MKTRLLLLLIVVGATACWHSDGVIQAHGTTSVEVATFDGAAASAKMHRRDATFDDAVEITVLIACSHPGGISDLQRQALTTKELDARGVDQASFNTALMRGAAQIRFSERLADGMAEQCPAALEAILAAN